MVSDKVRNGPRITAVLGPTNTGKTHYALDRMLGYRSGIIGLPLRLLAREVYDKLVALRGPNAVALVTGEERIVPERAQYWVATVEAMPEGLGCEFVAIDEVQLCADRDRGHVFTDRLLRMRGSKETLFLGAETMGRAIASLIPEAEFLYRDRFSELVHSGSKKLSRMPGRSAIVGFSVDNLYAIAELMRRQKGGVAVVMGALSPRTRNAQVEMYQNGDVDYLVATDAIGMGLNLDIDHVAFSALNKFDGHMMRPLEPNELAQIAGRAGRYMRHGSFGVTGDAAPMSDELAKAITTHQFAPVRKLMWRNVDLTFGNLTALLRTLESPTQDEWLVRAGDADDVLALKALAKDDEVFARATDAQSVKLLWDICRLPDFRAIGRAQHAELIGRLFGDIHEYGHLREDWFARQIKQIDRTDGDIDTLSKRLAFVRTWTYVAQRRNWLSNVSHWREETRVVEDRLSDALHNALTKRFVDRRTSILLRRLKQKESLVADVNDKSEVIVEGQFVGRLEGFQFRLDATQSPEEAKTLRAASLKALAPELHLRADRFYNASDTELDFTEQGGLMWGELAMGKLVKGDDLRKPRVQAFVDVEAGEDVIEKVTRRLQHFIDRKVQTLFEPLNAIEKDETLNGLARGVGFRMIEALGIIPREQIAQEIKDLDQDARSALRKHGVRFGQFTIFMPLLLKPAPTRLRLVLDSLFKDLAEFPESPPAGLVTIPVIEGIDPNAYMLSGYRPAGQRAIRIDMLERLADQLRAENSRAGFETKADMLSITGMTLEQFADLMQGLGYKAEKGERPKVKKVDPALAKDSATAPEGVVEAAPEGVEAAVDAPVEPTTETPVDATKEAPVDVAGESVVEKPVEIEVFYTFTWGGFARARNAKPRDDAGQNGKPQGGNRRNGNGGGNTDGNSGGKPGARSGGKPGGKPAGKPGGKPGGRSDGKPQRGGPRKGPRDNKAKTYQAGPRKDKAIDPDNPFAALLALKDKS